MPAKTHCGSCMPQNELVNYSLERYIFQKLGACEDT